MPKLPVKYQNPREHSRYAKALRNRSTTSEQLLWNALQELRKETGFKFRRQHPLHPYVADFACVPYKLIVEIDGYSHDARQNYDSKRDSALKEKGWSVIRFSNDEVCKNLEGVVVTIIRTLKEMKV